MCSRGKDGGHLLASSGLFPVEEEEVLAQLDGGGQRSKSETEGEVIRHSQCGFIVVSSKSELFSAE